MRRRIHGWWPVFGVAVLFIAAFWLLYLVWRSPHRVDLATYGAFAAAVVTLLAGWAAWAWRSKTAERGPASANGQTGRLTDLLAVAVRTQWSRAAGEWGLLGAEPIPVTWGRPSMPLAGPASAAARSQRFAPLPGLAPVTETQLASGRISDLHSLYGGLGSGRLVIAGEPGSGKSSAAVLLVLAALAHRAAAGVEDRERIPVPVLFTAQDWDPRRQQVRDWLTQQLRETYLLFTGRNGGQDAAGLIDTGKIAVIIDGLDEIAGELRPVALQALSEQAGFRIVILSRTGEMAAAASRRGGLQGAAAIELRAIDPFTAAAYLERVQLDPLPHGWRDLIDGIRYRPESPLARALNSPLALTLVRDTYRSGDDVRELLNVSQAVRPGAAGAQTVADITYYLLDRVLPAAYAARPGQPPPRYDLAVARRALVQLATRMNQVGTRDLQWWRIRDWAPRTQRMMAGGIAAGVVAGVAAGVATAVLARSGVARGALAGGAAGILGGLLAGSRIVYRMVAGDTVPLIGGVVFGVVATAASDVLAGNGIVGLAGAGIGLVGGLTAGGIREPPTRRGRLRFRLLFTKVDVVTGAVLGVVIGVLAGLGHPLVAGIERGIVVGIVTAAAGGVLVGVADAFADPDSTSSSSPALAWQEERKFALVVGAMFGLGAAVFVWVVTGAEAAAGAAVAIGLGAAVFISNTWAASLAMAQLALTWHTPLHLMRFLEDARERNVLRSVGPVYQFRHARLQDRLAGAPDPDSVLDAANPAGPASS